ncbi:hypothetical protein EYF80_030021 [Liparis tanakae]|uniref:Uncharacterized protein n=1 Tax=Liparis tanakae TaxID=230148 RepID=A0A4Z2H1L3_9TELE|nr:hypothetical protein EYF80_030021 [Liparis tanakae]
MSLTISLCDETRLKAEVAALVGQSSSANRPELSAAPGILLPLLSLYVALLSSDASPDCTHPPCRDMLVAAPIQPRTGAGVGSGACEGQTGTTACKMRVSLPAISNVPRIVENRHEVPQVQPKTGGVKERLVQLQRCMRSLQDTGGPWSPGGQENNSLGAILALMAAVLTECDLHCHSQALGVMAKRLVFNQKLPAFHWAQYFVAQYFVVTRAQVVSCCGVTDLFDIKFSFGSMTSGDGVKQAAVSAEVVFNWRSQSINGDSAHEFDKPGPALSATVYVLL